MNSLNGIYLEPKVVAELLTKMCLAGKVLNEKEVEVI